jgi:hypothetical protein
MTATDVEANVLAEMPADLAFERLAAVHDPDAAVLQEALKGEDAQELQRISLERAFDLHWPGDGRAIPAWKHSGHSYGYMPPEASESGQAKILDARDVTADKSLKKARVNVRLSQLHVESYPGGDQTHRVLFTFQGRNQVPETTEDLAFNITVDVREGEDAPIVNWPIFVGLNVGSEGVGFHFETTNVANREDHKILDFMDSPTFKSGLKLVETAQPAIKPLTDIALGLGKTFLTRSDNVKVHEVSMGLDFGRDAAGVRLAEGDYVVAQVPKGVVVDWSNWTFEDGAIRAHDGYGTQFIYNYLIFSVNKYEGD